MHSFCSVFGCDVVKVVGIPLLRWPDSIRANRLVLANRFRVPELNPFFANRASGS